VTKSLGDNVHGDSITQQQRRVCVPQFMELQPRQSQTGCQNPECSGGIVREQRSTVLPSEEKVLVPPVCGSPGAGQSSCRYSMR
jgi:hypothetical protein